MTFAPAPSSRALLRFAAILFAALSSCRTPLPTRDATVRLLTPGPTELGVATDYGIIFLGRGRQSGNVQFDVWFGKDVSRETGVIEAVGGGLCLTRAEIEVPRVPLTFEVPPVDSRVLVLARAEDGPRRIEAVVCTHPAVSGMLLRLVPGSPKFDPSHLGAGVYVERNGRIFALGLISGTILLPGDDGAMEEYLAVVGPEETWRVVTHGRNRSRERRWVYREDVL